MNKILVRLVAASLAVLLLAAGCGLWLLWQSWEDGRRLELQNRELQASLEASRIRLDNFCEYPSEAICRVERNSGSVGSAMNGTLIPPMPSEPAAPLPSNGLEDSSSKAGPAAQEAGPARPEKKETEETEVCLRPETPSPGPAEQAGQHPSGKTWTTLEQDRGGIRLRIAGAGESLTAHGELREEPLRYEVTFSGLWNIRPRQPESALISGMRQEYRSGNTLLIFLLSGRPEHSEVRQEDPRTISVSIR